MADARVEYEKRLTALDVMMRQLHKCKVDYKWNVPTEYQIKAFEQYIDYAMEELSNVICKMRKDLQSSPVCIRLDERDIDKIVGKLKSLGHLV